MKIMNRRESKKIAVMAAVIVGFMLFAFMPAASATVTSFRVTPGTGLAGAVDSYNVLVTTDGVTSINITIPLGFIAVVPMTGGVEIARVEFWNTGTRDYYGFATITANDTDPTTKVDIHCEFGGATAATTQTVNYNPGATNTFVSNVGGDTSSAIIKLPTEDDTGSINITINCTAFLLEDVHIAIKQFVRNPTTAGDHVFSAEDVDETVSIIAPGGRAIVLRDAGWHADTNGDHVTDLFFWYGSVGDVPVVGDINHDGFDDTAVFRNGAWHVDTTGDQVADLSFWYGDAGDVPVVGDINQDGKVDTAVFRNGVWHVDTTGDQVADLSFWYGDAGDVPVVGDINQDGKVDTAVFRNGVWHVDTDKNQVADLFFGYGDAGDVPVVGDINQDGKVDTAVFRNGVWHVDTDKNQVADLFFGYGIAGDIPLVGDIG